MLNALPLVAVGRVHSLIVLLPGVFCCFFFVFFFTDLLHSFLSLYSAYDQKCIPVHAGLIVLVYLRIIVHVKAETQNN